jgi:hypothetical protein
MSTSIRRRINEIAHRLALVEEVEVKRVLSAAVRTLEQGAHPAGAVDAYLAEVERTTFVPSVDKWLAGQASAAKNDRRAA